MSELVSCDFCKNKIGWGNGMKYNCLHFFCEKCILHSILIHIGETNKTNPITESTTLGEGVFNCLICENGKSPFNVNDYLAKSATRSSLISDIQSKEESKCQSCEQSTSNYYCIECKTLFCHSCIFYYHNRIKTFNHHNVNELKDKQRFDCSNCNRKESLFNCCNNFYCTYCILMSHCTHNYKYMKIDNEYSNTKKNKNEKYLFPFAKQSRNQTNALISLSTGGKRLVNECDPPSFTENIFRDLPKLEIMCKPSKLNLNQSNGNGEGLKFGSRCCSKSGSCNDFCSCCGNGYSGVENILGNVSYSKRKKNKFNSANYNNYNNNNNNNNTTLSISNHNSINFNNINVTNVVNNNIVTNSKNTNTNNNTSKRRTSIRFSDNNTITSNRNNTNINTINTTTNRNKNTTRKIIPKPNKPLASLQPTRPSKSILFLLKKINNYLLDEKNYYLNNYSDKSKSFRYLSNLKFFIRKIQLHVKVAKNLSPDQIKDGSNDILIQLENKEEQICRVLSNDLQLFQSLVEAKRLNNVNFGFGYVSNVSSMLGHNSNNNSNVSTVLAINANTANNNLFGGNVINNINSNGINNNNLLTCFGNNSNNSNYGSIDFNNNNNSNIINNTNNANNANTLFYNYNNSKAKSNNNINNSNNNNTSSFNTTYFNNHSKGELNIFDLKATSITKLKTCPQNSIISVANVTSNNNNYEFLLWSNNEDVEILDISNLHTIITNPNYKNNNITNSSYYYNSFNNNTNNNTNNNNINNISYTDYSRKTRNSNFLFNDETKSLKKRFNTCRSLNYTLNDSYYDLNNSKYSNNRNRSNYHNNHNNHNNRSFSKYYNRNNSVNKSLMLFNNKSEKEFVRRSSKIDFSIKSNFSNSKRNVNSNISIKTNKIETKTEKNKANKSLKINSSLNFDNDDILINPDINSNLNDAIMNNALLLRTESRKTPHFRTLSIQNANNSNRHINNNIYSITVTNPNNNNNISTNNTNIRCSSKISNSSNNNKNYNTETKKSLYTNSSNKNISILTNINNNNNSVYNNTNNYNISTNTNINMNNIVTSSNKSLINQDNQFIKPLGYSLKETSALPKNIRITLRFHTDLVTSIKSFKYNNEDYIVLSSLDKRISLWRGKDFSLLSHINTNGRCYNTEVIVFQDYFDIIGVSFITNQSVKVYSKEKMMYKRSLNIKGLVYNVCCINNNHTNYNYKSSSDVVSANRSISNINSNSNNNNNNSNYYITDEYKLLLVSVFDIMYYIKIIEYDSSTEIKSFSVTNYLSSYIIEDFVIIDKRELVKVKSNYYNKRHSMILEDSNNKSISKVKESLDKMDMSNMNNEANTNNININNVNKNFVTQKSMDDSISNISNIYQPGITQSESIRSLNYFNALVNSVTNKNSPDVTSKIKRKLPLDSYNEKESRLDRLNKSHSHSKSDDSISKSDKFDDSLTITSVNKSGIKNTSNNNKTTTTNNNNKKTVSITNARAKTNIGIKSIIKNNNTKESKIASLIVAEKNTQGNKITQNNKSNNSNNTLIASIANNAITKTKTITKTNVNKTNSNKYSNQNTINFTTINTNNSNNEKNKVNLKNILQLKGKLTVTDRNGILKTFDIKNNEITTERKDLTSTGIVKLKSEQDCYLASGVKNRLLVLEKNNCKVLKSYGCKKINYMLSHYSEIYGNVVFCFIDGYGIVMYK